jgi:hypothetical protein
MSTHSTNPLRSQRGITLLELLIAAFLTSLIATAAFHFHVEMSGQSEAQFDLANAQLVCRNSLMDIKKTLRMAGFKLPESQPAYRIAGDTLSIYMAGTQPIDTITYYLDEFTQAEYADIGAVPQGRHLYNLMKKTNSDSPEILGDFLTFMTCDLMDSANVIVSLGSQTQHQDLRLKKDNGYRTYAVSERINIRNMGY